MRTYYRLISAALVALVLTLAACQKDPEVDNDFTANDVLDDLLTNTLEAASGGEGISYYRMPESDQLNQIPQDPNNPLTRQKVELGKLLFHETMLAQAPKNVLGQNEYSCSSCHHAWAGFQAGRLQGIGEGGIGFGSAGEGRTKNPGYLVEDVDVQPLRTPSALNSAYQTNHLWNGQFGATGVNEGTEAQWAPDTPIETNFMGYEGVETQAIAGLAVHRMTIDTAMMANSPTYVGLVDVAFSGWSEERKYSLECAGLAIAAYERTLLPTQSPFQLWLKGQSHALTEAQKKGAVVFFGKGECASCHNGPSLANMEFHAIGMNDFDPTKVLAVDPNGPANKGRGGFTGNANDDYKFKVPQLYNLKDSPFYGHGGSFTSVRDVVAYKNAAVKENNEVPDSQLAEQFHALDLTEAEITWLVDFIENGLYDPDLQRYVPTSLPSGQCFPNNDALSRVDMGCD